MPSAEVKTPGGCSFELPLDENKKVDTSKRPPSPPKSKSVMSLEEINAKLTEAEKRRRSAETKILENLAEENAKILKAKAKIAEKEEEFKATSEKVLCEKMSKVEVNKQTKEEEQKSKFQEKKNHMKEVQEKAKVKKQMGDCGDADPCTEQQ